MSALVYFSVELLVLDVNNAVLLRAGRDPVGVLGSVVKGRPDAKLIFVVGFERNLLRINTRCTVRIDGEQRLAVVLFSMNEGYEEATRLSARDVLQDARVEVVVQVFPHDLGAIPQECEVTSGATGFAGSLQLLVSAVGEAKHEM